MEHKTLLQLRRMLVPVALWMVAVFVGNAVDGGGTGVRVRVEVEVEMRVPGVDLPAAGGRVAAYVWKRPVLRWMAGLGLLNLGMMLGPVVFVFVAGLVLRPVTFLRWLRRQRLGTSETETT